MRLTARDQKFVLKYMYLADREATVMRAIGPKEDLVASAWHALCQVACQRPRPSCPIGYIRRAMRLAILYDNRKWHRQNIGPRLLIFGDLATHPGHDQPGPDSKLLRDEALADLYAAVNQLPDPKRTIVAMRLEGMEVRAIARMIGRCKCGTSTHMAASVGLLRELMRWK